MRATLVVTGITLGILLLFVLQFAIPYWMGPAGLIVVGVVDAAIFLGMRHRRTLRQRARAGHQAGGPADRRPAIQPKHRVGDEIVVVVALLVFIIGIYVQGLGLRVINPAYLPAVTNAVLYWLGYAVVSIAFLLFLGTYKWGLYSRTPDLETYDTTDDH